MEYKIFKAKTVDEAITSALIEFGVTSDMLDYDVVDRGSSGLLGLFSKEAIIKAKPKEKAQEEEPEEFSIRDELNSARVDLKSAAVPRKSSSKPEKKKTSVEVKEAAPAAIKPDEPFEIKEDMAPESNDRLDVTITRASARAREKDAVKNGSGSKDGSKDSSRDSSRSSLKADTPVEEHHIITGPEAENKEVNDILNLFFEKLDVECTIETSIDVDDRVININIKGDQTSDIIGRKGQTLDAIQYLISIIVNKKEGDYYRVKVDTNNYRERRQKTLENQARNVAAKVKKTRRKVVMEPMNPYERRIIHSYLQSDKSVTTKSEGEEPNRRVVVYYKKS